MNMMTLPKFQRKVRKTLFTKLENKNSRYPGCLVDMPARLGENIYIDKFYQAGHLFQISEYVNDFAKFIVRDFIDSTEKLEQTNVVILSYNLYSKLLTEKVKNQLEIELKDPHIVKYIVTGTKTSDVESNAIQFDFHGDFEHATYNVITLVPIATTLITFENLIRNFKSSYKNCGFNFIFNHCSVLIRDDNEIVDSGRTELEKEYGWEKVDTRKRIVLSNKRTNRTCEQDTPFIHYTVTKKNTWHRLIDKTVFPPDFWEERFILDTKNSSLNIINLLDYPQMSIPLGHKEDNIGKRLDEMSKYIYYGHIHHFGKHFRYFFDIPEYIKTYSENNRSELRVWVEQLKDLIQQKLDNVIVTPEPEQTPYLSSFINKHLFNDSADIIFFNKQDRNFEYKYSYLKNKSNNASYFFVDPALLTGNSYYTAKNQMSAILVDTEFKFKKIFTVINRLSKTKYQEITDDLEYDSKDKENIHAFVHFFIPPCKTENTGCYLCNLTASYENLKNNSVITDCRNIIESNRLRYNVIDHQDLTKDEESNIKNDKDRVLNRIKWVNRIFYEISSINKEKNIRKKEIKINEKLDKLLRETDENVDNKISFIKAISFPPLSDYARIRKYAFERLLKELHEVLKKRNPQIRDLILLKILLKRLAMLGSNALVRKDVIIKSLLLYTKVREQLPEEIKKLIEDSVENPSKVDKGLQQDISEYISNGGNNIFEWEKISDNSKRKNIIKRYKIYVYDGDNKLNNFPKQLLFYIKIATHNDPSKSLWLGELLRTGKELDVKKYNSAFSISETEMFNNLFSEKPKEVGKVLPYLFYENTAIIQKTLNSFEKETTKWNDIFEKDKKLNEIKESFGEQKKNIISDYKKLVNEKQHYNWFRKFYQAEGGQELINQDKSVDGIQLIEKYTLIIYAKLLLKRLLDPSSKGENDYFDKNAKHLLEIFSEIIDAQAAYISIRPHGEGQPYTLSIYYSHPEYAINRDTIQYNQTFYSTKLLNKKDRTNRRHSFVMRNISGDIVEGSPYGESFNNKFYRAAFLTLNKQEDDGTDNTIGLVTFLFGTENQKDDTQYRLFMKEKQELGKLLLLLKPELDEYVQHVAKEKQFEEWVRNQHLARLTLAENHGLNLAGWDFDNLAKKDYLKIYNGIYMLSDVVIRHLYAILMNKHEINLKSGEVLKISEIFDEKFKSLLNVISDNIWNGRSIKFDSLSEEKDVSISDGLKQVFQSYVIQLLDNAAHHADCTYFNIHFSNEYFEIENDIQRFDEVITFNMKEFHKKYNGKAMESFVAYPRNIDDYGFTLLSLYYYIKSLGMKCVFDFKENDPIFFIRICYQQKIKTS